MIRVLIKDIEQAAKDRPPNYIEDCERYASTIDDEAMYFDLEKYNQLKAKFAKRQPPKPKATSQPRKTEAKPKAKGCSSCAKKKKQAQTKKAKRKGCGCTRRSKRN